jgi:integrase
MKWQKTKTPGVRFREHASRKHGIQKDRYFSIYYQDNGKRKEEGLGWASFGWTLEKASYELSRIRKAHRVGEGPQSLAEKRKIENERRETARVEAERIEKENITFGEFFHTKYLPANELIKKTKSLASEKGYFKNWISPVIGEKSVNQIYPLHLERVRKNMLDSGKSPRSIEYALAVIRQIWNMARRDGLLDRESPTKQIKKMKFDNKRVRFLTYEETDLLLKNLATRSQQLHDMALLSLHTGLRAGEVFSLTWGNVDLKNGLIYIVDSKGGSRTGHMTETIKQMFIDMKLGIPDELIFKDRWHKGHIKQISRSFNQAVDALGLNNGVTDHRQKVTFHTLRHTFASWLVQQGEPLYTVQKLLGHASIAMTERYSHLAPDTLKAAVRNFEINLKQKSKIVKLHQK